MTAAALRVVRDESEVIWSQDMEIAVLGSILIMPGWIHDLPAALAPEHFFLPANAAIFAAMLDLDRRGIPPDLILISNEIDRRGQMDLLQSPAYLAALVNLEQTPYHLKHYGTEVLRMARERRIAEAKERVANCPSDSEHLPALLNELRDALADNQESEGFTSLEEGLRELNEDVNRLAAGVESGIRTGLIDLDQKMGRMQSGDLIVLAALTSAGKAQPLDAKVLTPTGWTTMGNIAVGDSVASVDGQASQVIGVFPQGRRQVYRVKFSDGRSVECCGDHLWKVQNAQWNAPRILSTDEVSHYLTHGSYKNRMWVEQFSGEFGAQRALPLDPWFLGAYLGDGHTSTSVLITSPDAAILERVASAVGPGFRLTTNDDLSHRIRMAQPWQKRIGGSIAHNGIMDALKALGLHNKRSWEKFIPDAYKHATRKVRTELLQGLLDTDGWVEQSGSLHFGTASLQLAKDVQSLVWSLGGICKINQKTPTYSYNGKTLVGRTFYSMAIVHLDKGRFITLSRKRQRIPESYKSGKLTFASIEETRMAETQCIAVSHPAHLYVTDDYIVTHNTSFVLNVTLNVIEDDHRVAVFSMEMNQKQVAKRLVGLKSGVPVTAISNADMTPEQWQRYGNARGQLAALPLRLDAKHIPSVEEMRRQLLAEHRAAPFSLVVVDLLGSIRGGGENRTQEVSGITHGLKALAREMDVPIMACQQGNRQASERGRIQMSDIKDSSTVEQVASIVLLLTPPKQEGTVVEKSTALIEIAKNRDGEKGIIPLYFHWPTMRFGDLAREESQAPMRTLAPVQSGLTSEEEVF